MIRALALIIALLPALAVAQQLDPENSDGDNGGFTLNPELDLEGGGEDGDFETIEEITQGRAVTAEGGVLRALDRITGALTDVELANGQTTTVGRLRVMLSECRFPKGNPSGDAYGFLIIQPEEDDRPVFQGWMIASSPALNALDHPRYDVWILRCNSS